MRVKVHYPECLPYARNYRVHKIILQGLANSERVQLVPRPDDSDFIFLNFTSLPDGDFTAGCSYSPEKLVFFDWHDDPVSVYGNIQCLAYFKRSWVVNHGDRKEFPARPAHFYPITFAMMDEFLPTGEEAARTIDLGAYFGAHPGTYRQRVKDTVSGMPGRWSKWVGLVSPDGVPGRSTFNPDYLATLRRTRTIVTCQPDLWEGDTRTWEAFASGALVAVDRMETPLTHPLRDREHCIVYDRTDQGFAYLRESLEYYLNRPEEAASLARRGYEYAMRHHRTANRIDDALDVVLALRKP